ncbi:MAG: OmpA family protein [Alphaproteobacteria bacterium]|nr:OmpA family protein [Alphaproteobacteria bacterium]
MTRPLIFSLLALVAPLSVAAQDLLTFPEGSVQGYESLEAAAVLQIPVGPYRSGKIDTAKAAGSITRQVWKTPNIKAETLGLISPLRNQLEEAGYKVLFECETKACGGFDFRFNADVVDEPEMHVDLGDFRYLSASKLVDGQEEFVGLLVSKSPDRGFIQYTKIGAGQFVQPIVAQSTKQTTPETELLLKPSLEDRLNVNGAVVLEGLEFLKGSSELSGNPSTALQELATLLAADTEKTVVLVGHTDASGSLEGNITLSRKRADSVMARLVETYGVNPAQLSAEGVGYLSPRATNATDEGRDKNRRVEVVVTVHQ